MEKILENICLVSLSAVAILGFGAILPACMTAGEMRYPWLFLGLVGFSSPISSILILTVVGHVKNASARSKIKIYSVVISFEFVYMILFLISSGKL